MITKAYITAIPAANSNEYQVSIPRLDSGDGMLFPALASVTPGYAGGYNVGDCVFVDFENDIYSTAIIIGKLDVVEDSVVGNYQIDTLNVTNSAILPQNTKIGNYTTDDFYKLYQLASNINTSGGGSSISQYVKSVEQTPSSNELTFTSIDNNQATTLTYEPTYGNLPDKPSDNVTGSGSAGYIAKWNGTNTITNGPGFDTGATTTYLRHDGSWATPPDTNTTYTLGTHNYDISLTPSDGGNVQIITPPYATNSGNADTVDNKHASAFVDKKPANTFYNYIGACNGGGCYKITFPSYAGTGSAWYMTSFEIVFGGPWGTGPSGRIYVSYYVKRNSGTLEIVVAKATAVGVDFTSALPAIYYDTASPYILYVSIGADEYRSLSLVNLTANDSSRWIDYLTTTIEVASLPSSGVTAFPVTKVSNSVSNFAPTTHTHTKSQISDLATVHYATSDSRSTGWYKININSYNSWMLAFTIRVYQAYQYYDIICSGYNYGSQHWYSPSAVLIGSSSPSTTVQVMFGYDSDYHLWVAIPASSYTGIDIVNVTNGYTQVTNPSTLFTVTYTTSVSGTAQTTIVANRGMTYGTTVPSGTALDGTVYFKY